MSISFEGTSLSEGIGIGEAFVIKKHRLEVPQYTITDSDAELDKLSCAIKKISESLKSKMHDESDILESYVMLLEDPNITKDVRRLIVEKNNNAAMAIEKGMQGIIDLFYAMDDEYMRDRARDVVDIKLRLFMEVLGITHQDMSNMKEGSIVVADEFMLSEAINIDFKKIKGVITRVGGKNSHVSIIARNYNVPVVSNISNISNTICGGEMVIVDGVLGKIIYKPSKDEIDEYNVKYKEFRADLKSLNVFRTKPNLTKDGVQIDIMANVGSENDVDTAIAYNATGIGLLRSEFLFLEDSSFKSEEEQFLKYKSILIKMAGKPVGIRLFDMGGDKDVSGIDLPTELNTALGCRGIRLCFRNQELLRIQLKALLRASVYGKLRIILPMVSCVSEIVRAKKFIETVKKELTDSYRPFDDKIKIGVMIEVPAAAIMCDKFAKESEFFSIGTNDLTQYVLAADRVNETVSGLYTHYDPAVLRLIKRVTTVAAKKGVPCAVCGEAVSDPQLIEVFIGMGITRFSVAPSFILNTRKKLSEISIERAKSTMRRVLNFSSAEQVKIFLDKTK